jgi:hypothetical protein
MPDLMTLIQNIESAGFDGAGILDSQMLSRDAFVVLGQAATHTRRLCLFPAVTNPVTRHASVLASAILTVEELAPGRVKFVIGTGYTSASTIGRPSGTLAEMRDCIRAVKGLLAGETVDFNGTRGSLSYASGRRIPVLMAASGPKAIEVRGRRRSAAAVGFNRGTWSAPECGARRAAGRSPARGSEIIWAVNCDDFHGHGGPLAGPPDRGPLGCPAGAGTGSAGRREAPEARDPDAVRQVYPDSPTPTTGRPRSGRRRSSRRRRRRACEALGLIDAG